jgi:hypothetical protein
MSLGGYEDIEQEDIDKPYLYQAIGESVLNLKLELRLPITESDVGVVSGERGFSLPTAWLEWLDEMTAIRLDPGRVLAGTLIPSGGVPPLTLGDVTDEETTLGDITDEETTLGDIAGSTGYTTTGVLTRMDRNGFTNTIGYVLERAGVGQDSEGDYLNLLPEHTFQS